MLQLDYSAVGVSTAIGVVEAASGLVQRHLVGQARVVCRSTSESGVGARACFGGLFAGMLGGGRGGGAVAEEPRSGDASRDALLMQLLRLLIALIQVPVVASPRGRGAATAAAAAWLDDSDASSLTDNGKMATSTPLSAAAAADGSSATDEQKTETAATAAAAVAAAPTPCAHFTDSRAATNHHKVALLADAVLRLRAVPMQLIGALGHCNSSTMAMIVGSSRLPVAETPGGATAIQQPQSVGDVLFQLLCALNRAATDVRLVVEPLHAYLSGGGGGGGGATVGRLSEPLLWFALQVLDCSHSINMLLEMGKPRALQREKH